MELEPHEWDKSEAFLSAFDSLFGDERTRRTYQGIIHGIIAGESLRAAVIARFSPEIAGISNGERRVRRMAERDSTKRSRLDADSVTNILREQGVANLWIAILLITALGLVTGALNKVVSRISSAL